MLFPSANKYKWTKPQTVAAAWIVVALVVMLVQVMVVVVVVVSAVVILTVTIENNSGNAVSNHNRWLAQMITKEMPLHAKKYSKLETRQATLMKKIK